MLVYRILKTHPKVAFNRKILKRKIRLLFCIVVFSFSLLKNISPYIKKLTVILQ